MNFTPFLAELVAEGRKTQTRRLAAVGALCPYRVGLVYGVVPGRGKTSVCHIRITSVREEAAGDISWRDARAEGYRSPWHFIAAFARVYGLTDADATLARVWRIEFTLER